MTKRIFISYSKADAYYTEELAKFLENEGYTVWWDTEIRAGEVFREVIERELDAADAVIVIWTKSSIKSNWVIAEADHAARREKLITLRASDVEVWQVPKPYNTYHSEVITNEEALLRALHAKGYGQQKISQNIESEIQKQEKLLESDVKFKTIWNCSPLYFLWGLIWAPLGFGLIAGLFSETVGKFLIYIYAITLNRPISLISHSYIFNLIFLGIITIFICYEYANRYKLRTIIFLFVIMIWIGTITRAQRIEDAWKLDDRPARDVLVEFIVRDRT